MWLSATEDELLEARKAFRVLILVVVDVALCQKITMNFRKDKQGS